MGFDYSPFYQEHGDTLKGIAVDLAQELFPRLGMQPDITMFPLKRALAMLGQGQTDGTMVLIRTPDREKFLHFTEPFMTVRGVIWSAADREKAVTYDRLEDLKGYKIGVTRGYSYGPELDDLLKTMNTDTANSDYSNYLKLVEHRIDIFPGNELIAEELFKKHTELQGKLVHSNKAFMKWDLCIAMSRKSKYASMLPEIQRVLSDLKREGILDNILKKYK